jgi:hypothetical protein
MEMKEEFRRVLLDFQKQAEANLGDVDKQRRSQIDMAINEMMRELRNRNQLKEFKEFTAAQFSCIFDILRKVRDLAVPYNSLIEIFGSEDKERRFLDTVRDFGLGRFELIQMYLAIYVTACILSTELFKLLVLFQVEGAHRVSDFNRIIPRLAPDGWSHLEGFVNSEFRNALAHGLYIIEGDKVTIFKNTALDIHHVMVLHDFIMEVKNQNILFWSMLLNFLQRALTMF